MTLPGPPPVLPEATELAIAMICKWGMEESLPPRTYIWESGGFLGGAASWLHRSDIAEKDIDREINHILADSYQQALDFLRKQRIFLGNVAATLLTNEILDKEDLDIIARHSIKEKGKEYI
jgi:cell division protease FtsH